MPSPFRPRQIAAVGSRSVPRGKQRAATSLRLHILCAFALASTAVLMAAMPCSAVAAQAGPFEVEGPAASYDYVDGALVISGEGVSITGMADPPSAEANNVTVNKGVQSVSIGPDVSIATMQDNAATSYPIVGTGNSVDRWANSNVTHIDGTGFISIGEAMRDVSITNATVEIRRGAQEINVYGTGTIMLGDQAEGIGMLSVYGGTLDLSELHIGQPILSYGYSLGAAGAQTRVVVPFGTESLSQLLQAPNAFVRMDDIPVFSDGEEVGVLLRDGTIHYTATRTVTFEGWGGAVLQTENVRLFQPAVAPADVAAPEGYAFVGWDRDFSRIDRDLTVKALFEAVPAPEPDPNAGGGNESGNGAGEGGGSSGVPGVSGKTARASSSGMRAGCLADTGDAAEGPLALAAGLGLAAASALGAASMVRRARRER